MLRGVVHVKAGAGIRAMPTGIVRTAEHREHAIRDGHGPLLLLSPGGRLAGASMVLRCGSEAMS